MHKLFVTAAALAATFAQPATATTFPTLTTIYVGSGVTDTGTASHVGVATAFHCTNVSGLDASIRFLVLSHNGNVEGSLTVASNNVDHGSTITIATHDAAVFNELFGLVSAGIEIDQGGVVIESTQSAVFCSAMILDAAAVVPNGIELHLVRINPHPGTVE